MFSRSQSPLRMFIARTDGSMKIMVGANHSFLSDGLATKFVSFSLSLECCQLYPRVCGSKSKKTAYVMLESLEDISLL